MMENSGDGELTGLLLCTLEPTVGGRPSLEGGREPLERFAPSGVTEPESLDFLVLSGVDLCGERPRFPFPLIGSKQALSISGV